MKTRLYLQLGRLGDILNVLPLCLRDHTETGKRPVLMVARDYASILEGVTYVEPLVWGGDFEDVHGAMKAAEEVALARDLALVVTQIYGRELWVDEGCSSFLRESWARLPDPPAWGSLPLVFDRRDITRETHVARQLLKRATPGKPYVVLALNGTSSPFPFYPQLSTYLRNKLGKEFDFVDVSGFIAPRFYDLLTLLDGAAALVAVDSAVLHLAAAVPSLKVVALITREPTLWHGSAWRPQHAARFFYDECPEAFRSIWAALNPTTASRGYYRKNIVHTWTAAAAPDPETTRRIEFARSTWAAEHLRYPYWLEAPFKEHHASRDSTSVGDERPMPFMKDVIDHAVSRCPLGFDVIALTNADVSFVPGLSGWIIDRMNRDECAFTHRRDFPRLERALTSESQARRGAFYPGSDAFFFTVAWWRRHRHELPDLVLGREKCDEVLRQLIKRHGGGEIPNAIYHEKHPSYWKQPGTLETNGGNRYNRRLALKWFLRTGYGPNDWRWWAIPGGTAPGSVDSSGNGKWPLPTLDPSHSPKKRLS